MSRNEPPQHPRKATHYHYSIVRIMRLKKELFDMLWHEYQKHPPVGKKFDRMIELVYELLPKGIPQVTLEDSLRHLTNGPVNQQELNDTCWRIAGNIQRLRDHKAVTPWRQQYLDEWVPLQIMSCWRERRRDKPGALVGYKALAGIACPVVFYSWTSNAQCRYYAFRMGFTLHGGTDTLPSKYGYSAPEQLVRMRLYALLSPDCSTLESPGFRETGWPPSVRTYNHELLRARFRVDHGYDCPRSYPSSFHCQHCPAGFAECSAATHQLEWKLAKCETCKRKDAFFDPQAPGVQCVDCMIRGSYKRE